MSEEYLANSDGMVVTEGTWTYKIPTIDTIPKQFNVEVLNSGHHKKRVLSSKASGEPPLLLAVSVHCATRAAIKEARKQLRSWGRFEGFDSESTLFDLDVPATMPVVKELCGLNSVENYLQFCTSLADFSTEAGDMTLKTLIAKSEDTYQHYNQKALQPEDTRRKQLDGSRGLADNHCA
ncbi:hypothetical protein LguiB_031803 [Lonicera macranthoides]